MNSDHGHNVWKYNKVIMYWDQHAFRWCWWHSCVSGVSPPALSQCTAVSASLNIIINISSSYCIKDNRCRTSIFLLEHFERWSNPYRIVTYTFIPKHLSLYALSLPSSRSSLADEIPSPPTCVVRPLGSSQPSWLFKPLNFMEFCIFFFEILPEICCFSCLTILYFFPMFFGFLPPHVWSAP